MQWKVIGALIGLFVIAVGAYILFSAITPLGRPGTGETDVPQGFEGPVGAPYVEGPSGPPPGNN